MSRGHYGSGEIRVAGFGDQLRIARLAAEYDETYRALADQAKTRLQWSGWFAGAVEPMFAAWTAFRQSVGESIDPTIYKSWSDKLAVIRAGAQSLGMKAPMSLGTVGLIGGGVMLGLVVLAVVTRRAA